MANQKRIQKLNKLLRQELARIILKNIDFSPSTFVTLTRVDILTDLSEAKVYVLVFPKEKTREVLDILAKNIYFLQRMLDKKLRMHSVPKISFFEDKVEEKAMRVEQILDRLK